MVVRGCGRWLTALFAGLADWVKIVGAMLPPSTRVITAARATLRRLAFRARGADFWGAVGIP